MCNQKRENLNNDYHRKMIIEITKITTSMLLTDKR